MTTDLTMLTWSAAFTIVLWVPYILCRLSTFGLMSALTYQTDGKAVASWAERLKKAHYNAVENLIPFTALVLVAHISGTANETTALAATIYFWARIAHAILYTTNVPFGRSLSFATSWAAMVAIFLTIIMAL